MKVGIIGGMGPQAGINLASKIMEFCPGSTDQEFIEFVLHNNTRIPDRTQAIVYNGPDPLPELIRSVHLMNDVGADVIVLACVTAHYFYDELSGLAHGEILHPVTILKKLLLEKYPRCRRIGILATTGTMRSGLFNQICEGTHFQLVTLDAKAQEEVFMHSIYGTEGLKSGNYSQQAIAEMQEAANLLLGKKAEIIVGGCTEVSLAIDQSLMNVPFIDLVALLAQEAVNKCKHLVTDI